MPLTFTYAPGFLEQPDETQADAIKLAKFVLNWWENEKWFANLTGLEITAPEVVKIAHKILEKHDVKNLL